MRTQALALKGCNGSDEDVLTYAMFPQVAAKFFASRAEGLILPGLRSRMNREAELLDEWLKEHRSG